MMPNATSIIWVKLFWRSSAVVTSPVTSESLMVHRHRARAPLRAAFMYSAGASISTASTPIFCHCSVSGVSS